MSEYVPYLPIMLDCRARPILVIGGGRVAERKIIHMLEAKAIVIVISPEVTAVVKELAERGKLHWLQRTYIAGDLSASLSAVHSSGIDRNSNTVTHSNTDTDFTTAEPSQTVTDSSNRLQRYLLVYAATSRPDVNQRIAEEAQRCGIPVNVADRHELGTFINPAVIRRGRLVASVSTSGAGPAISRRIVSELENYFDEDYELYMEFMYHLRHHIKQVVHDPQERRRLLEQAATLDVLAQIRHKQFVWWDEEQIEQWIIQYRGR
ncbi:bifunctional precorrin-2 dehydrogenase/sirohydrochlorin ferrochelatase [Paenibacillus hunanensis]|uniref:precorrin-2 dehydrogenase/sirohydrochlorin ferrochelatase family protein n=1 Tax=Paenibacillus hunanensis TaxID=539262 RepID=UPI002A699024|nr:bifunctional precorrin-2 dehydrogenase/sirohydrochlorin ferrochelatase [Paenibacillus hunanensis]WPP42488.1 bifunctional precorrin-2 dehydrogenase/sirohydrochlorin ferrochelatase [Paenibacillus hunanensis]